MIAEKNFKAKYSTIRWHIKPSAVSSTNAHPILLKSDSAATLRPDFGQHLASAASDGLPSYSSLAATRSVRLNSLIKRKFPKDFFAATGPRNHPLPALAAVSTIVHSSSSANISLQQTRTIQFSAASVASKSKAKRKLPPMSMGKPPALDKLVGNLRPQGRVLGSCKSRSLKVQTQALAAVSSAGLGLSLPRRSVQPETCGFPEDLEDNMSLLGNSEFVPAIEIPSIALNRNLCMEKCRKVDKIPAKKPVNCLASRQIRKPTIQYPEAIMSQDKFTSCVSTAASTPTTAPISEETIAGQRDGESEDSSRQGASSSTSGSSQSIDRQVADIVRKCNKGIMRPVSGQRMLVLRRVSVRRKESAVDNDITFGPQD